MKFFEDALTLLDRVTDLQLTDMIKSEEYLSSLLPDKPRSLSLLARVVRAIHVLFPVRFEDAQSKARDARRQCIPLHFANVIEVDLISAIRRQKMFMEKILALRNQNADLALRVTQAVRKYSHFLSTVATNTQQTPSLIVDFIWHT